MIGVPPSILFILNKEPDLSLDFSNKEMKREKRQNGLKGHLIETKEICTVINLSFFFKLGQGLHKRQSFIELDRCPGAIANPLIV